MKRVCGALFLSLAVATPSHASGPSSVPFSWSGFYLGAHLGAAWSEENVTGDCTPSVALCNQLGATGTLDDRAIAGGLHAGYNWALTPSWVLGLEGDVSWTNLDKSTTAGSRFASGFPAPAGGWEWSHDIDWITSVRGRIGFAVIPCTLVYFTAGAAWQRADFAAADTFVGGQTAATSFSATRTGYTVGGGLEWALFEGNWLLRAEYLYYDFDSESGVGSFAAFPGFGAAFQWSDNEIQSVRTGISYKF